MKRALLASAMVAALAWQVPSAFAQGVTEQDLANDAKTPTSILTNGMGRAGQRFSPLEKIN